MSKQTEAVEVLKSTLELHKADPDGVNVALDLGRLRLIAAALSAEPEATETEAAKGPAPSLSGSEGS